MPAILFVGCGKAPIDDPSTEAYQIEALRKEGASLKSKLASTQSHIDSLRLELNNSGCAGCFREIVCTRHPRRVDGNQIDFREPR